MSGDWFPCQACGARVATPEMVRYSLSSERPAVCAACGARHVFDASLRLDQGWVREKLSELGHLRESDLPRETDRDGAGRAPESA